MLKLKQLSRFVKTLLCKTQFKDARSVSFYPYNQSQNLQNVKYTI